MVFHSFLIFFFVHIEWPNLQQINWVASYCRQIYNRSIEWHLIVLPPNLPSVLCTVQYSTVVFYLNRCYIEFSLRGIPQLKKKLPEWGLKTLMGSTLKMQALVSAISKVHKILMTHLWDKVLKLMVQGKDNRMKRQRLVFGTKKVISKK